jgi:peptidylprolyl isomerase
VAPRAEWVVAISRCRDFLTTRLIDAEFEIDWNGEFPYTPVESPDMFATETGTINGFAIARDPSRDKAWLTHCPGIIAMARNDDPDSSRTDSYIVIGQDH